jgi:hypothetical protein
MAYLQLAENNGSYNMLAEGSVLNNYLTIPPDFMGNAETKYVRLDYFDNLPDEQFALTMAKLAPYQPVTLLSAKGDGIIGAASFAAGFIPGVGPIVSKVVEKAGPMAVGLIGKKNARKKAKAGAGDLKKTAVPIPDIDANVTVGGKEFAVQYATGAEPAAAGSFFKKYKMPLIIGGSVVALVAGYMLLKKKRWMPTKMMYQKNHFLLKNYLQFSTLLLSFMF